MVSSAARPKAVCTGVQLELSPVRENLRYCLLYGPTVSLSRVPKAKTRRTARMSEFD